MSKPRQNLVTAEGQADSELGLTNQQKPRKQDHSGQRVRKQNELPAQAIGNRAKWDSND
jgi:hypothetical protein